MSSSGSDGGRPRPLCVGETLPFEHERSVPDLARSEGVLQQTRDGTGIHARDDTRIMLYLPAGRRIE